MWVKKNGLDFHYQILCWIRPGSQKIELQIARLIRADSRKIVPRIGLLFPYYLKTAWYWLGLPTALRLDLQGTLLGFRSFPLFCMQQKER